MPKTRTQSNPSEYIQTINPQGYINNREITNLADIFLVKGSQNMLIQNKEKVVTSGGYTLVGAAKTLNTGIKSNYDWKTSTGEKRSTRQYQKNNEIFYKGSWLNLETGLLRSFYRFAEWWNETEQQDVVLSVDGTDKVKEWSGSVVEIAAVTASTISKRGYISGTTFSFNANVGELPTIENSAGGFNVRFSAGDSIEVQGSVSNDGLYTINSVDDQVLTLSNNDTLVTESDTNNVVIKWPKGGTWAEARALTVNASDSSDRAFTINGVKYPYSGGENTGTLTGITVDPTITTEKSPMVIDLVDSYSEINEDTDLEIPSTASSYKSQSFFNTNQLALDSCKFYLKKAASPTGNAIAYLYNSTGVLGSTAVPNGNPIATSNPFDVSTLTTSYQLITFTFSGINRFILNPNTNYCIVISYLNGDATNKVFLGTDNSSPTATGNRSFSAAGVAPWTTGASDICYYIYGSELTKPPVGAGSIAIQTVRIYTVSTFTNLGYNADYIFCVQNQICFGSNSNRVIFISINSDFTDFTESTLRKPGEGATITLDSCPTGFVRAPTIRSGNGASFFVTAGTSDIYNINFVQATLNDENGIPQIYETTPVQKLETGYGSAAISQEGIIPVRNGTIIVSQEPTIDTLGNIANIGFDSPKTLPLSDPIKNDIENYDNTGAHGVYFKRNLYVTYPKENVLVIHDFINGYWQPPQIISLSRLAVIEIDGVDRLCGHSAHSNETYQLFNGLNQNGAPYLAVAAFGYSNFGTRFYEKGFDEIAVELYLSKSTKVFDRAVYDYRGATDIREFLIDGSDDTITFMPSENEALGESPLGSKPLGTSTDEIDSLGKCRVINGTTFQNFFEYQRIFSSESIDAQFQILAFGVNTELADSLPNFIKK